MLPPVGICGHARVLSQPPGLASQPPLLLRLPPSLPPSRQAVTAAEALATAEKWEGKAGSDAMLAQPLVDRQLLLDGRPFYIRCASFGGHVEATAGGRRGSWPARHSRLRWPPPPRNGRTHGAVQTLGRRRPLHPLSCSVNVVVCGSDPVRAYLYRGGTVVMSDRALGDRPRPADFVVLFQSSSTPTDLRFFHELNATLSAAQMEALWRQIEVGLGRLLHAAAAAGLLGMLRPAAMHWRQPPEADPAAAPGTCCSPRCSSRQRRRWRQPCPRCGSTGRAAARTAPRPPRLLFSASTSWLTPS